MRRLFLSLFCASALRLPSDLHQFEAIGKPKLLRYLSEVRDLFVVDGSRVDWLAEPLGAKLMQHLWCQISEASAVPGGDPILLALPCVRASDADAISDIPNGATLGVELCTLPAAPVPVVAIKPPPSSIGSSIGVSGGIDAMGVVEERSRSWVDRTLAPGELSFCPYTASRSLAASGLEALGVTAAPIAYSVSDAGSIPALLCDFWRTLEEQMLLPGESGTSSILLMAPTWDGRWEEWSETVFPTLEATLVAAGLSRKLGIVCFHPCYSTPDATYLAKHRFGHMHSTERLRRWLDDVDAPLSRRVSDEELHWAGSYQRRSPHATINVLWARQLEVAETRRDSPSLYTRNLRRALQAGFERLHEDAERERGAETS